MRKFLILLIMLISNVFILNAYNSLNEVLQTPVSYNIYKGKNTEKTFNAVRYTVSYTHLTLPTILRV